MLKVTNIQKSFNGHHVLKGIDFEINKGGSGCHSRPIRFRARRLFTLFKFARTPRKGILVFTDGSLTIDFSKKNQQSR